MSVFLTTTQNYTLSPSQQSTRGMTFSVKHRHKNSFFFKTHTPQPQQYHLPLDFSPLSCFLKRAKGILGTEIERPFVHIIFSHVFPSLEETMYRLLLAFCCITFFFAIGCTPFAPSVRVAEEILPNSMPAGFPSAAQDNDSASQTSAHILSQKHEHAWWKNFASADLDAIVDRSLQANFDILTAWATLRQSEALTQRVTAGLFPSLDLDASGSQRRISVQEDTDMPRSENVAYGYSLGLAAAYEVDLWGSITSERRAELLRTTATAYDLQTSAMTVAASVAETWAALLGNRAQLAVLKAQIEVNTDLVRLQNVRFSNGLSNSLEVLQQKELLASIEAEVPPLEQEAAILRNRLDILQGNLPGTRLNADITLDENAPLPPLDAMPDPGLPIELLDARPDIQAAWARLAAADWDISAAHAKRYPSLRLSASMLFEAASTSLLFTNWVAALAGSLAMPLFDGGALAADEARAKAISDAAVQAYVKTVATAIEEVDNALATEKGEQETLKQLQEQYVFAQAARDEARNSYLGGVTSFLNYITALRNVQSLERTIARQHTTVVQARISLYRVLGGHTFPNIMNHVPEPTILIGAE